jgi:hypothetical protein
MQQPPLVSDLFPGYFCATAIGPQGGSLFKRGVRSVETSVRFSDTDLPIVEVLAYRDNAGSPCVRLRARLSGGPERLFYEGPLSAEGVIPGPREARPSLADPDACPECEDRGWAVFNACPEEGDLGEIQACDCGIFPSDAEALAAAREAGLSVDDDYQVLSVP